MQELPILNPLLRMLVSLAVVPGDAERVGGWVSTGWDREPANTHAHIRWVQDQDEVSRALIQMG